MIKLTLHINPIPKGRPRFFKGLALTPPKTRRYETEIRYLLRRELGEFKPLDCPLKVTARFVLKKPKKTKSLFKNHPVTVSDLDNYVKSLDGANGILWEDDAQIVELHAYKLYDMTGGLPRIELEVERVGE